jgi:hypothetical protein
MKDAPIAEILITQLMLLGAAAKTRETQAKILDLLAENLPGLSKSDREHLKTASHDDTIDAQLLRGKLKELQEILSAK